MSDESTLRPLDYRGPPEKRKAYVESPEEKCWRRRRVRLRIGLIAVFAPIGVYFGPNLIMFHQLTRPRPRDFLTDVQKNGVPVVQAILKYQRDKGKLPMNLQDLEPDYLREPLPVAGFMNRTSFSFFTRDEEMINYEFTPGMEAWSISGPFLDAAIPAPKVTLATTSQPAN